MKTVKLIKQASNTIHVDVLDVGSIVWLYSCITHRQHELYYISNRTVNSITFKSFFTGVHSDFGRSINENNYVYMPEDELYRMESKEFDQFREALEQIDFNLSIKNLKGKDAVLTAIEILSTPSIDPIVKKFSRGQLNITKLVEKRIAYAMSKTDWYRKHPEYSKYMEPKYGSINNIWYEDLARLMMKDGTTVETFYAYLDTYVSKMKEAKALQTSAKAMFGYK